MEVFNCSLNGIVSPCVIVGFSRNRPRLMFSASTGALIDRITILRCGFSLRSPVAAAARPEIEFARAVCICRARTVVRDVRWYGEPLIKTVRKHSRAPGERHATEIDLRTVYHTGRPTTRDSGFDVSFRVSADSFQYLSL